MKKTLISMTAAAAVIAAAPLMAADHQESPALLNSSVIVIGAKAEGDAPALADVLAGDHRSDKARARDAHRHPAETLEFFGLQPDMTVVEIWPGGGWYMDVVAPVVAANGQYIAVGFDRSSESDYIKRATKAMIDKVESNSALFGQVTITEMSAEKLDIAPEASADMVLTFRNVHNWMSGDYAAAAFAAMYKALKPGGVLGVVEHRASSDDPQDPKASSGYVRQDFVIKMAEDAGFQLVDTSEINANPADTKDHPSGVWTLPPSLAKGDENRDKYLAIGESDRMTLKFIKPATGGMAALQ